MKSDNYDFLFDNLKAHDEQEMLMITNKRIDKITSKSSHSANYTLKALICEFEAKNNLSSFYAVIAIVYSLIVALATIMPIAFENTKYRTHFTYCIVGIIVVGCIALLIASFLEKKNSEKKAFILNALKFKYDELKQRELEEKEINKLTCSEDEKIFIVKVKKNE